MNGLRYIQASSLEAEAKLNPDIQAGKYRDKYSIGEFALDVPLRLVMEDDDGGKHVCCLELPMLYGFGDSEEEALAMLDRDILSLLDDLRKFSDLPPEYRSAAATIRMAMKKNAQH